MYKKTMALLLLIIVLAACTNTREGVRDDDGNNNTDIQPMHFESEKKTQNTNNKEGNQSQQKNRESRYSDAFTNEESLMLTNTLEKRKDIMQAQVATTDDRVIVGVMLSEHTDHNTTKKIESEIKEIIPDKQIIIYTDDTRWERMKNLDAKLESKNIGNDVEDNIKELFNIND